MVIILSRIKYNIMYILYYIISRQIVHLNVFRTACCSVASTNPRVSLYVIQTRTPTSTSNLVMSAFHWKNSCTAPPKSLAASLEEKLCLSPALLQVTRNLVGLAAGAESPEASWQDSASGRFSAVVAWVSTVGADRFSSPSAAASALRLAPFPPFLKPFFFLKVRFCFQTSSALVQGRFEASCCSSFSVSSCTAQSVLTRPRPSAETANMTAAHLGFFEDVMFEFLNYDKQVVYRPQKMCLQLGGNSFLVD